MKKTKPCPACNTELETPGEYFVALKRMNEEVLKFREVIIKDYEIEKRQNEVRKLQYWRNIDNEPPVESMRDHSIRGKNTFPLVVFNPNGDPYFEAFRIARYNYACRKMITKNHQIRF